MAVSLFTKGYSLQALSPIHQIHCHHTQRWGTRFYLSFTHVMDLHCAICCIVTLSVSWESSEFPTCTLAASSLWMLGKLFPCKLQEGEQWPYQMRSLLATSFLCWDQNWLQMTQPLLYWTTCSTASKHTFWGPAVHSCSCGHISRGCRGAEGQVWTSSVDFQ